MQIMKKILTLLLQLLLITGSGCLSGAVSAADTDGAILVQERRCYGCHHITQALIGPAYTAIAARHAANKPIMEKALARKIVDGGAGTWGVVPRPILPRGGGGKEKKHPPLPPGGEGVGRRKFPPPQARGGGEIII